MTTGQRVLIADDHPLTREGLALAARAALPGSVVDQAGSIGEAQAAIASRRSGYALVLLDLMLPDAKGFSGFLALQHALGSTPIVVITAREDSVLIDAARALGAAGYLFKSQPIDTIAQRLRTILSGTPVFPSDGEAGAVATARERIATLSGAQLRVLLALADGRLNKQIAGDLDISEATVKAHMTAIFRKLGVNNRAQALLAVQPLMGDAGSERHA
ncbi:response regulator transcription factor [uncultured Sphingomonas sp.]|uniref:response regulator transcription factor n=1 Tax=uncultured Sphingomonas sp. TaxID=158754 RepID=UPI0025D79E1B|nr:response regulator transcription factor [uncultured Sphingomonas sp.]